MRLALAELDPVNPLRHQNPARRELLIDLRDVHAGVVLLGKKVLERALVRALVLEVELGIEADSPLVEQRHVVGSLLGGEAINEPLVDFGGAAQHVEVLGDEGEHVRALHLHRNCLARDQRRLVHLRETGSGHRFLGDLCEELAQLTTELRLDEVDGDLGVERLDRVLENRQLIQGSLGQHVRADGHHLACFDVGRAKLLHVNPRLPGKHRLVLLDLIHPATDKQRDKLGEERHGHSKELAPSLLKRAILALPVCLDQILVVNNWQPFIIHDALPRRILYNVGLIHIRRLEGPHTDGSIDSCSRNRRRLSHAVGHEIFAWSSLLHLQGTELSATLPEGELRRPAILRDLRG
mmetsp:Transcript_18897/g.45051  ORF Transcript_18897/g.45051 Transcript_18897/m.45051 type:complete len:351 (-) Transcript_18897:290-1342(-)